MIAVSESEQRFLRSARQELEPSASDAQRVLVGLEAKLALGALSSIEPSSMPGDAPHRGALANTAKSALKVVIGAKARALMAAGLVGFVSGYFSGQHAAQSEHLERPTIARSDGAPGEAAPVTTDQHPFDSTEIDQNATRKAVHPESLAANGSSDVPAGEVPSSELTAHSVERPSPHGTGVVVRNSSDANRSYRRHQVAASGQVPAPIRATTDQTAAQNPDALSAEVRLLERAERAIRKGEPALALALLKDLGVRFPAGKLSEEREAARLMAQCQTELDTDHQRAARTFLEQHPGSMYLNRLHALCGLDRARARRDGARQEIGHKN